MGLLETVRDTIDTHHLLLPGDTVVVGVSGGADSLCLLHVLRRLTGDYGVSLHVGHLNHRIRGLAADSDADYVEQLCLDWGVPCTINSIDVPALAKRAGVPLEEGARRARYGFLAYVMHAVGGKSVAVGHHADDQVETVLMHFLRGAGLGGLRGMSPLAWMEGISLDEAGDLVVSGQEPEQVRLLRPLLEVSRADIDAYCREHGLEPRHDETNDDSVYYRNRVRHQLVPLLETYNRNVREVVRRTAKVVSADNDLLRQLAEDAWPVVVREVGPTAISFDLDGLRAQPLSLRRRLVRHAMMRLRHTLADIEWVHIDDAVGLIDSGVVGTQLDLPGDLRMAIDYQEALFCTSDHVMRPAPWPRIDRTIPLRVPGSVYIAASRWTVSTRTMPRSELPPAWDHNSDRYLAFLDADSVGESLALRTRQDGDWFVPLGFGHRQKLHDYLINAKFPRRERDMLPLLVSGDDICWVVGWRLDERFSVTDATDRVLVVELTRV